MRRITAVAAAAAAAFVGGVSTQAQAVPADVAAKAPKGGACAKGEMRFRINGRRRCVAVKLGSRPRPRPDPDAARDLVLRALDDRYERGLLKAVPKRLSRRRSSLGALAKAGLGRGGSAALGDAARAMVTQFDRVRARTPRSGSTTLGARGTARRVGAAWAAAVPAISVGEVQFDRATGAAKVTGKVTLPNGEEVSLTATATPGENGNGPNLSGEIVMSYPLPGGRTLDVKTAFSPGTKLPRCPSVKGELDGTVALVLRFTYILRKGGRTLAAYTKSLSSKGTVHGVVGDDALLDYADVRFESRRVDAQSVREYGLALAYADDLKFALDARIDGAALRAGSKTPFTINPGGGADYDHRVGVTIPGFVDAKRDSKVERFTIEQVQTAVPEFATILLGLVTNELLRSEENWRTPNACVQVSFSPSSPSELGPGATTKVQGRLLIAPGTQELPSTWARTSLGRGAMEPANGSSTPGAPLDLTATAALPDDKKETVSANYRATSRAGIGEGPWGAKYEPRVYDVRFAGKGTASDSVTDAVMGSGGTVAGDWEYEWEQKWSGVELPLPGAPYAARGVDPGSATLSGSWSGSYADPSPTSGECSGPIRRLIPGNGGMLGHSVDGGPVSLTLIAPPFTATRGDPGVVCSGDQVFVSTNEPGLMIGREFEASLELAALPTEPKTYPVASAALDPGMPCGSRSVPRLVCSRAISWTGTITLTPRAAGSP